MISNSELEERIKRLEDVVFDGWLKQYGYGYPNLPTNYVPNVEGTHTVVDFEHNYIQEPNACPPYVPTQGASQEDVERAMKQLDEWNKAHGGIKHD